jgi:hypothetical protein
VKNYTVTFSFSLFVFLLFSLLVPVLAFSEVAPRVYFIEPTDGTTVTSPFKVRMGVEGMLVEKAGQLIDGTGHHHLIINGKPVEPGSVVPADEQHIHFGDGQTETEIELPKGKHTLTLQFADGAHRSYGPHMTQTITVEVQ